MSETLAARRDAIPTWAARSLLVLPLAIAVGCAPPDASELSGDELIDGAYTSDRPEVGIFSTGNAGCTATLVGARDVLTASHCVSYETEDTPGSYGTFYVLREPDDVHAYTVERYVSYGRGVGEDDVAILRLAEPVPPEVATPAGLADTVPPEGEPVTIYGYGCRSRDGTSRALWVEQSLPTTWGAETANLCPGDSGGPTMTDDGRVVRVNSGYWLNAAGADLFGVVPVVYDLIVAQVAAWGDELGEGTPASELPSSASAASTAAPLAP